MITLKSYAAGEWKIGTGRPRVLRHAVTGEEIAQLGSEGVDGLLDRLEQKIIATAPE